MLCKLKSEESKMTQRSTYNCILTSEKRESVAAYTVKSLIDTTKIKNCVISTLFEKKLHKKANTPDSMIPADTENMVNLIPLIYSLLPFTFFSRPSVSIKNISAAQAENHSLLLFIFLKLSRFDLYSFLKTS